jgi:hypothetical protein
MSALNKGLRPFLIWCAVAALVVSFYGGPGLAAGSPPELTRLQETYGRLPLHFIENRGQMDSQVKFCAQGHGYALFFTPAGVMLAGGMAAGADGSLQAALVKVTPLGQSPHFPQGEGLLPGKVNYLVGNDPRQWRTQVPTYGAVRYREVFPGIDLKFYGAGPMLEYDLIIRAGADPTAAKFQVEGIEGLEVTGEGDLAMRLPGGKVVMQKKPVIYQEISGRRIPREGKFHISDKAGFTYGFQVAAYDASRTLVIDPAIAYSTFLGGGQEDQGLAIAADGAGNAYVTGQTFSTAFPVTQARPFVVFPEVFVTRINAAGNALVFSTFLGGQGSEAGTGIARDGTGVYVTGWTDSLDFPVVNAFQPTKRNGVDAFVAKLNLAGNVLIYSTFLGGGGDDRAAGIALSAGQATVVGTTNSIDFPRQNAVQPFRRGGTDAFVTRLNAAGNALVFSTYLGGALNDTGNAVAVDGLGRTYVTGGTFSLDFPTLNPFQGANFGNQDAFVTRLLATGALDYSTFLGGSGADIGRGIAVNAAGQAFVVGETASLNFPVLNAFQGFKRGGRDAFVTKFNGTGTALIYSTFLGGSKNDQALGITLDTSTGPAGRATVVGVTSSFDFPIRHDNAIKPVFNGGVSDAFVTRFTANGLALVYSTYLGGNSNDQAKGVARVGAGAQVLVTGVTNSFNFPISNAFQPSIRGGNDAFVTRILP